MAAAAQTDPNSGGVIPANDDFNWNQYWSDLKKLWGPDSAFGGGGGGYTPLSTEMNQYQKDLLALINRSVTNNLQNASLSFPVTVDENRYKVKGNATLRSTPTSIVSTNIVKTYPANTTIIVNGVLKGKSSNSADPYEWHSVVEDTTGVNGFIRSDGITLIRQGISGVDDAIALEETIIPTPATTGSVGSTTNVGTTLTTGTSNPPATSNPPISEQIQPQPQQQPRPRIQRKVDNKTLPIIAIILAGIGLLVIFKRKKD